VRIWEPRWVTSSGREMRVSPSAYYNVFGDSALTWNVVTEMSAEGDPVQGRARSLNLARLLWRDELPDTHSTVTGVDIYLAEYRLQAPSDRFPPTPIAQTMLYTFPLAELSEGGTAALTPGEGISPQESMTR
jgi:hypothetical protein